MVLDECVQWRPLDGGAVPGTVCEPEHTCLVMLEPRCLPNWEWLAISAQHQNRDDADKANKAHTARDIHLCVFF